MHGPPRVLIYSSPDSLSVGLGEYVAELSAASIEKHGVFTIAVSGGTLPHHLSTHLKTLGQIEWDKWHVFFVDERVTDVTKDPLSVYAVLKKELLSSVPIPTENIHILSPEYADDAESAAEDYIDQMIAVFSRTGKEAKFPVFDLILLGIGPDGHTASLFPGHALLLEAQRWCAAITDSPKPPAERITLTLPVLNHAHHVAFVVTEDNKTDLLAQILDEKNFINELNMAHKTDPVTEDYMSRQANTQEQLPCLRVRPVHGQVVWFLDEDAGKDVKYPLTVRK